MRLRWTLAIGFATALWASVSSSGAIAFTSSMAVSKDKMSANFAPNVKHATPYAALIANILLAEVKRTHRPFAIASPFRFIVLFRLDREGRLADLKIVQGANLAEANDYAEQIVRRALLSFPPPPANTPDDRLSFLLPLTMTQ